MPRSYIEAIQHSCWRDAIKAKLDAFEANNTWEVVDLPPRNVPIGCKIVCRIKYKSNGEIERFKVTKRYTQQRIHSIGGYQFYGYIYSGGQNENCKSFFGFGYF